MKFHLEKRADTWVVVWRRGGCRPANDCEIAMWKALRKIQRAAKSGCDGSATHAISKHMDIHAMTLPFVPEREAS